MWQREVEPSRLTAMDLTTTLVLFFLAVAGVGAKLPLPDYVKPCSWKLSDKKLGECAVQSARLVMPAVLQGDAAYSIPVLKPLYVDRMVVINGNDGPLGMRLVLKDVDLHGIENITIDTYAITRKPPQITYLATLPDVLIRAKYNVSGRILLLPLVGQGNAVMTLKNVKIAYQYGYEFKKSPEDGEVYFIPRDDAKLTLDADAMSVVLDNLFNGDKALLDNTNKFLNDEWREVFESARPAFEETISRLITTILTGIFTKVPFKDAFTDVEEEVYANAT